MRARSAAERPEIVISSELLVASLRRGRETKTAAGSPRGRDLIHTCHPEASGEGTAPLCAWSRDQCRWPASTHWSQVIIGTPTRA